MSDERIAERILYPENKNTRNVAQARKPHVMTAGNDDAADASPHPDPVS
jgi:hypothetical protein